MRNHWENVYQTKAPDAVSWYQPQADKTLALLRSLQVDTEATIIDVGSGASVLIDALLAAGFGRLYVLDISATALQLTQARLRQIGLDTRAVTWLVADICEATLPHQCFDVWHDRAVFHFMVTDAQQQQYLERLNRGLKPNGYLLMSTFAQDGPEQCSGLPVTRYTSSQLQQRLGDNFALVYADYSSHITPWGSDQRFLNTVWQKTA